MKRQHSQLQRRLFPCFFPCSGEQGWRSDESTRLSSMWPEFDSRSRCHMWVEFVVGSRPCSERFFSGYFGFPLSSKPTSPPEIPIRSSVSPISSALMHGYKIETIIKLVAFIYMKRTVTSPKIKRVHIRTYERVNTYSGTPVNKLPFRVVTHKTPILDT